VVKNSKINPSQYSIFIVSNEPWGKQWFIKHHYANELAKLGFDVHFLNPVGKWSFSNLFDKTVITRKISENLDLVEISNPFPLRIAPFAALKHNDKLNARKLSELSKGKKIILWQFDAFRFAHNFFHDARKIYHVADHYRDLPFDAVNAENADLIVCTSETFVDYYKGFGKPTIYIPHAISAEEYDVDKYKIETLRKNFGKFFLHAGTINDRIELGIFKAVCERLTEHKMVLIGPQKLYKKENRQLFDECLKLPNFVFQGPVEAADVKNYTAAAEICLLAYDFEEVQTLGPITSSLKVLNYLAQYKPIVSSSEIEYGDLLEKAIFCAANLDQYLEKLNSAVEGNLLVDSETVREFLDRHTYVKFIGDIIDGLEQA
jgi:glycosyltransferase involved in cell wall biosynthesis